MSDILIALLFHRLSTVQQPHQFHHRAQVWLFGWRGKFQHVVNDVWFGVHHALAFGWRLCTLEISCIIIVILLWLSSNLRIQFLLYWCCFHFHHHASSQHEAPRAYVRVVGMLQFMSFDIKQLSLPTPFYSALGISFCLYSPFNCISFRKFSPATLRFLTLFFQSYFCLFSPFDYISVKV